MRAALLALVTATPETVLHKYAEDSGLDAGLGDRVFKTLKSYRVDVNWSREPTAQEIVVSFALAGNAEEERVEARFKKVVYGARLLQDILASQLAAKCGSGTQTVREMHELMGLTGHALLGDALRDSLAALLRDAAPRSGAAPVATAEQRKECAQLLYAAPVLEALAAVSTKERGGEAQAPVHHLAALIGAAQKPPAATFMHQLSARVAAAMDYFADLAHPGPPTLAAKLGVDYLHAAADGVHALVGEHVLAPTIAARSTMKIQNMMAGQEDAPVSADTVLKELKSKRVWSRELEAGEELSAGGKRSAEGKTVWSNVKGYRKSAMDSMKGSWELNIKRTYATYDFIFSIVDKLGELLPGEAAPSAGTQTETQTEAAGSPPRMVGVERSVAADGVVNREGPRAGETSVWELF